MELPADTFGESGEALWKSIEQVFDFTDEPTKVELLAQACRVADIVAELDAAAIEGPLTVRGSQGQQVISPLIAEARVQRALLATLIGKLKLPETDEAKAERAERLSRVRSAAAKSGRLRVVNK
jgi:hypothetical protein